MLGIVKRWANYLKSTVPDAGTGMMTHQTHGHPFEVYPCPQHTRVDCGMCGGSGFRAVCNKTACHEDGCQDGSCARSKDDYQKQETNKAKGR